MKPGPAISTDEISLLASRFFLINSAISRGLFPLGFANASEMEVAKSPCSRFFGRSKVNSFGISQFKFAERKISKIAILKSSWIAIDRFPVFPLNLTRFGRFRSLPLTFSQPREW